MLLGGVRDAHGATRDAAHHGSVLLWLSHHAIAHGLLILLAELGVLLLELQGIAADAGTVPSHVAGCAHLVQHRVDLLELFGTGRVGAARGCGGGHLGMESRVVMRGGGRRAVSVSCVGEYSVSVREWIQQSGAGIVQFKYTNIRQSLFQIFDSPVPITVR